MTIEKQVISLSLSKRLKELGVNQKSLFWYVQQFTSNGEDGDWKLVWGGNGFVIDGSPHHTLKD